MPAMPAAWMAYGHRALGMGEFPDPPIAAYLARLTSGLYAFYGILCLLLARDVRRYASLITYQAVAIAALAVVAMIRGLSDGMPLWWLLADVGLAGGSCIATLFLQYRVPADGARNR